MNISFVASLLMKYAFFASLYEINGIFNILYIFERNINRLQSHCTFTETPKILCLRLVCINVQYSYSAVQIHIRPYWSLHCRNE